MPAPPAMHMPLSTFDPYPNLASTYISPASIAASDSSFSWVPMPPHHEPNREYIFFRLKVCHQLRGTSTVPRHIGIPCERDALAEGLRCQWLFFLLPSHLKTLKHNKN
jgi:hypothetical protein